MRVEGKVIGVKKMKIIRIRIKARSSPKSYCQAIEAIIIFFSRRPNAEPEIFFIIEWPAEHGSNNFSRSAQATISDFVPMNRERR